MACRFLIFLALLNPIMLPGQIDYIITDSSYVVGIKIADGGAISNSKVCRVLAGANIVEYTPYDIIGYGVGGRDYVSKEIQIDDHKKQVFLERLINANTSLYFYNEKGIRLFFVEKDSAQFVTLNKHDLESHGLSYKDSLQTLTGDCQYSSGMTKLLSYNRRSLKEFIRTYNDCSSDHFRYTRYGITFGLGPGRLIPSGFSENKYLSQFTYPYFPEWYLGLFMNKPVLPSDFSFDLSLIITRLTESYNISYDTCDFDLVINMTSLEIPVQMRYLFPGHRLKPYINAGCVLGYDLENRASLYSAVISQETIIIDKISGSPKGFYIDMGYVIGLGAEFKLNQRNAVFIEFRHKKQYSLGKKDEDLIYFDRMGFHFFTGINF